MSRGFRWGFSVMAAVSVFGAAVLLFTASRPGTPAQNDTGKLISETSFGSVAGFAARALRDAGYLDAADRLADYDRVEQTGAGRWVVLFDAQQCRVSESVEECKPSSPSSATVSVRLSEGGTTYQVTSAGGPFTREERSRIESYQEDVARRSEALEFGNIRLLNGVDEGFQVQTSPIWNGPIPSTETASCHVELFGSRGEAIFTGPSVDIAAPADEAMRSGSIWSFGVPELQPADVANIDIVCT